MKNITAKALLGALPFLLLGLAGPAQADRVDWGTVPENIQHTITENDGGRQPEMIELKYENGQAVYEATVLDPGGLRRIVRTDGAGRLLAEEERQPGHDVDWSTVPPVVKQAIMSQAQHQQVEDVETQTQAGATVYVAEVIKPDGSKIIITVGPQGQIYGERSRSKNY